MIVDRHFLALLALLVATALVTTGAALRGEGRPHRLPPPISARDVPGWMANDGAPEDIVPSDSRAVRSVRRTYSRGDQTIWLVLARYHSLARPTSRPALNRIVDEASWTISRGRMSLDGPSAASGPGPNLLSLTRPGRTVTVAYWYELDGDLISSEYRLRLCLFLNTLAGRSPALLLVRIASDSPGGVAAFARAIRPVPTHAEAPRKEDS
jgi:EpsI family protein